MFAHFFAGCLITLAAVPDIIMPGYRHINVTLRFDAQPLQDHCCVQHIIKKGDTLSKIALAQCGNANAVDDLIALNPGIKPDLLTIGMRIWLPPRLAAAKKLPKTFVFHSRSWPFDGGGEPFAPMARVKPPRYGQAALLLVPEVQLQAFLKAKDDWQAFDKMMKQKRIQKIGVTCNGSVVANDSPTHKRTDTITIQRSAKGVYSASVKSIEYDKKGKVVVCKPLIQRDSQRDMWLLLLPTGGAGWLLLQSRRRRHSTVPVTA